MSVCPVLPIFTRPARISKWDRLQLAGPMEALTLREWEQSVLCCSLADSVRKLLIEALSYPASPACRRLQASLGYWNPWVDGAFSAKTAAKDLQELLRKELAALWYVLDTPALACTGLARDMLLVEHSIYLRTLLETLAKKPGARPLQQEVALALDELESKRPLNVATVRLQRSWLR
jgi:hypothetical protein